MLPGEHVNHFLVCMNSMVLHPCYQSHRLRKSKKKETGLNSIGPAILQCALLYSRFVREIMRLHMILLEYFDQNSSD